MPTALSGANFEPLDLTNPSGVTLFVFILLVITMNIASLLAGLTYLPSKPYQKLIIAMHVLSILSLCLRLYCDYQYAPRYLSLLDSLIGCWLGTLLSFTTLELLHALSAIFPWLKKRHVLLCRSLLCVLHVLLAAGIYINFFSSVTQLPTPHWLSKLVVVQVLLFALLHLGFNMIVNLIILRKSVKLKQLRESALAKNLHESATLFQLSFRKHFTNFIAFSMLINVVCLLMVFAYYVFLEHLESHELDMMLTLSATGLLHLHFPCLVMHFMGVSFISFPDETTRRLSERRLIRSRSSSDTKIVPLAETVLLRRSTLESLRNSEAVDESKPSAMGSRASFGTAYSNRRSSTGDNTPRIVNEERRRRFSLPVEMPGQNLMLDARALTPISEKDSAMHETSRIN